MYGAVASESWCSTPVLAFCWFWCAIAMNSRHAEFFLKSIDSMPYLITCA